MVRTYKQSCVHIWFPDHFDEPYEPLNSTDEALGRFVAPSFALGIRLEADGTLSVAAPFGLSDVFDMTIRPNPNRPRAAGWDKVVASAKSRWPEVRVVIV